MLRVSLSLLIDATFPDSDSDLVAYEFDPVSKTMTPWFAPTPGVIAWLGELLNRAAKQIRDAANKGDGSGRIEDRFELQRMRSTHEELIKQFGIAAKSERPDYTTPEEWKLLDEFLDNPDRQQLTIPGDVIDRRGGKERRGPGKILVWRPRVPVADGQPKVLGGVKRREADVEENESDGSG